MITETTYDNSDLDRGKCKSCGEKSDEILIGDGRCIDCIEAQKFEDESNRIWNGDSDDEMEDES